MTLTKRYILYIPIFSQDIISKKKTVALVPLCYETIFQYLWRILMSTPSSPASFLEQEERNPLVSSSLEIMSSDRDDDKKTGSFLPRNYNSRRRLVIAAAIFVFALFMVQFYASNGEFLLLLSVLVWFLRVVRVVSCFNARISPCVSRARKVNCPTKRSEAPFLHIP